MEIKFTCSCGQRVAVDSSAGGQQFPCPSCGSPLTVPPEVVPEPPVPLDLVPSTTGPDESQTLPPQPTRTKSLALFPCDECGCTIEFSPDDLDQETSIVSCPQCGRNTELPASPAASYPATSNGDPVAPPPPSYKHKRTRFAKGTRVALTSAQCETQEGRQLIDLLGDILSEGLVTEDGVRRLNTWLDQNADAEIPAIRFLLQISDRILRKGRVTIKKAFEMQFAIERVLPKGIRESVKEARQEAWLHSPHKPKATEAQLQYIRSLGGTAPPGINTSEASLLIDGLLQQAGPLSAQAATAKQVDFIRQLGAQVPLGISKEDASALIDELLAEEHKSRASQQPPTPRQLMVLRFWNRMDLARTSKWDVEQWLTQFYDQDPRRRSAWEAFKNDIGDDGSLDDPLSVPIGAYESYLGT